MKKLFFAILLLTSNLIIGQIKTTKAIAKDDSNASKPYDSLSNFLGEDVYKYIGQELYLKGVNKELRGYGYSNFYTTTSTRLNLGENIYKCCAEVNKYNSKYEDLAEKYFQVLDVTEQIFVSSTLGTYHQ